MSETRTLTLTIAAKNKQHACRIIEHIINPALRDYECGVLWPDMNEPEISVIYEPEFLREAFKARDGKAT